MRKYKELALVWGDEDSPLIIRTLKEVTEKEYKKFTKKFGTPKGRTEDFLDLSIK